MFEEAIASLMLKGGDPFLKPVIEEKDDEILPSAIETAFTMFWRYIGVPSRKPIF